MAGFMLNSHIKHPRKGIAWHVSLVICCCVFGHSRYPFPSSFVTQVPLPPFYLMYFLNCLNKAMAQMANNTKERKASCTISTYSLSSMSVITHTGDRHNPLVMLPGKETLRIYAHAELFFLVCETKIPF